MDILLSKFVNKYIDTLNYDDLVKLYEILKNDDDKILKMGGAPVGRMEFLDLEEYTIISFLRRWCDGDISRSHLNKELIINLGYAEGNLALQSFKDLCEIIFHHGRRSLIRHQLDCHTFF